MARLLLLASLLLARAPAAAPPAAAPPVVAPYLVASDGPPRLLWSASAPGRAHVDLFRRDALWQRIEAARQGGLFRAELPIGCDDGAELSYQVAGSEERVPLTALPCKDAPLVRFSFLTDTQQDPRIARRAAERIAQQDSAFVLHGGDFVNFGGSVREWLRTLAAIAPFSASRPLVPATGNHEYWLDPDGSNLTRFFGLEPKRAWYRFSAGPVDVFVLNSALVDKRAHNLAQIAWLREVLAQSQAEAGRWRVVLFHHPPYSTGIGHSGFHVRREYEAMRRYYVPAFEELGVDLVLSGHTHLYERSIKDGVHYVVGGAAGGIMGWFGGKNPYDAGAHRERTVSHIEATEDRLVLVTETLDGEELDHLELSRSPTHQSISSM